MSADGVQAAYTAALDMFSVRNYGGAASAFLAVSNMAPMAWEPPLFLAHSQIHLMRPTEEIAQSVEEAIARIFAAGEEAPWPKFCSAARPAARSVHPDLSAKARRVLDQRCQDLTPELSLITKPCGDADDNVERECLRLADLAAPSSQSGSCGYESSSQNGDGQSGADGQSADSSGSENRAACKAASVVEREPTAGGRLCVCAAMLEGSNVILGGQSSP